MATATITYTYTTTAVATAAPVSSGRTLQRVSNSSLTASRELSYLDRYLYVWILLAMLVGVILAPPVTSILPALQTGSLVVVQVSVPIAVGLLVMVYPILCRVRYEVLGNLMKARALWIQLAFGLLVNWILAPLVGLSWAFLPDKTGLREGLILTGIARCIAMVRTWTKLAYGDSDHCEILVALNSVLQIVLFAPLAFLYINILPYSHIKIPYTTFATSVAVFLGIPLAAAVLTRSVVLMLILGGDTEKYNRQFIRWISPFSFIGLLFTILALFASQPRGLGRTLINMLRACPPLAVYSVLIFAAMLYACRYLSSGKAFAGLGGCGFAATVTQCLTAASSNFELAIAVAVACYGPESPQALAATVGPLVEAPVMLGLVEVARLVRRKWQWSDGRNQGRWGCPV